MNKISSKHFMLFILGVSIISLKTYSSIFVSAGGRDTWISSLLAGGIFICFLFYVIKVCRVSNTFNINEVFFNSLPKIASFILLGIFILALFINAIEAAAVEANVLHTTLFIDTPVWYALIFFITPSLFIFNKKIRTILIFVLVSVFIFIINGVLLFVLSQGYKDINNLLPVFAHGIDSSFFITSILILGGFSTFMIAIPFLKFIDKHENLSKHTFYSGAIAIAFIVISFVGVITAFGPLRAANIFYPEFILSQRIELAGFLEFGELFFITQTVVGFFIKYVISSYSILLILDNYLKNKTIFIGIYTFIVFVLSYYLGSNNFFLYDALKYIQIINLIAFLIIPFIVYSLYYIKIRNKNLNSNKKDIN